MDFIWISEQVFKVADNASILPMLTFWQHLCSPRVPTGQTSRAGPPACPPPSVLGNPFGLPPSHLTWDNHSYDCLLECIAINSLQVLFLELLTTQTILFLCREHKLFNSSGNLDHIFMPPVPQLSWLQMPHAGTFPECVCQDRPPSWGGKCYVFSFWLEWSVTETSFSLAESSLTAF